MIRGDGTSAPTLRTPGRTPRRRPPLPAGADRLRGAAPRARLPRDVECRDRRVPVRRGDGRHARAARPSGRGRAPRSSAIRELIAWPRPSRRRLAQGLPRRHLRRRGLLQRRRRSGSRTPTRRSSTGPRAACDALGFDFVVEPTARPNGCRTSASAAASSEHLRFFHLDRPGDHAQAHDRGRRAQVRRADCGSSSIEPLGDRACRSTTSPPAPATSSPTASSATTASPAPRTSTSTSTRGATSSARSSSRSTCPRCCGRSWRGRRGRASTSRWARTPTRTSGSRAATSSCAGSGRRCATSRNPCSILTKSPLLLRDLDLLLQIAERADVSACLSVPTLDEKAWRATEPHTPHPRARLEAVAELNRAGIPTGILIAPLMPGINDAPEQVERDRRARRRRPGATSIGGQALFLRGEMRDVFFDWLRAHRPDLVERYEQLYRRGAYVAAHERTALEARLRPRAAGAAPAAPRSASSAAAAAAAPPRPRRRGGRRVSRSAVLSCAISGDCAGLTRDAVADETAAWRAVLR